jgi:hypothetical protein
MTAAGVGVYAAVRLEPHEGPLGLRGIRHGVGSLDDGARRGVHRVRASEPCEQFRLDDRDREGPACFSE